jgi:hypothetical protein
MQDEKAWVYLAQNSNLAKGFCEHGNEPLLSTGAAY